MIALIAPYDKAGAADLARGLVALGFDVISTSGTLKHLTEAGVPARSVSDLTGFPEILDGRVKTLHPALHAGLLARRDKPEHLDELARQGLSKIDLVAVILYPFRETVSRPEVTLEDALENIDIGGPTMLRAAAKNFTSVLVLVDPADYDEAIERLRKENAPLDYRRRLAEKAFQHVASYDTAIAQYLRSQEPEDSNLFPAQLTIALKKAADLRYGENPHQKAAVYRLDTAGAPVGMLAAEQLHGVEMSYLNYLDADAAWRVVTEFDAPAVVIVKHATPCGIASHEDIAVAYERAYAGDEISPFGGIIAANREVSWEMTEAMKGKRYDLIVAPDYRDTALERLKKRRDLRILRIPEQGARSQEERGGPPDCTLEYRSISGGMLAQTPDTGAAGELDLRVMTKRAPTATELDDLRFAWTALRHVKSNAIVLAKERATVGIGCGQPNRLWATQHALEHAGKRAKDAVLASDAFFPFARGDAVEDACKAGITAIIQPGGGVRDEEAVEVCNDYGVAMVFTATRAFRH